MPVIVVLAFVISSVTGGGSSAPSSDAKGALNFAGPPRADVDATECAKVLAQLPITLGKLDQRVVHTKPDTPFVVAWGAPPVVLRCGVNRPADLKPGAAEPFYSVSGTGAAASGPAFDVTDDHADDAKVFTTVDRAAYVSITIPRKYSAAQLPQLADAIAKALPRVCQPEATAPVATRCAERK